MASSTSTSSSSCCSCSILSTVDTLTLKKVQAGSGLVFSSFLGLHLGNALVAINSQNGYDEVQAILRTIYQHPLAETLVLGSLAAHIGSSLVIYCRREKNGNGTNSETPLSLKLHRWSAYFLTGVIGGHVGATRLPSLLLGGAHSSFTHIALTLRDHPLVFYPYYVLFSASAIYHSFYGISQAWEVLNVPQVLSTFAAKIRTSFSASIGPAVEGGQSPKLLSRREGRLTTPMIVSAAALIAGCALAVLGFGGKLYPVVYVMKEQDLPPTTIKGFLSLVARRFPSTLGFLGA